MPTDGQCGGELRLGRPPRLEQKAASIAGYREMHGYGARLIAEGGLSAADIVAALDATEPS